MERSPDTALELRLSVPRHDAELATDRLWGAGAQAIEEVECGDSGDAGTAAVEFRTVLADTEAECVRRVGPLGPGWQLAFVRRSLVPAHTWREHARPITISPRLIIVPAWQSVAPPDDGPDRGVPEVITIEPGAAFGLGDHPTTRLMLEAVDEIDHTGNGLTGKGLTGKRVLDVGTGTGVLAVVAAARGAEVTAIDIASASVEATTANAGRNGVSIQVSTTPVGQIEGRFDLILANILAPTLVAIAADLKRLLDTGGRLVVSGILSDRFDHVLDALAPLRVQRVRHLEGWAAVELGE